MNNKINDSKENYELANGMTIPIIAFGTGVVRRFYRNKSKYYKDVIIALLRSLKHLKMVRFLKNDVTLKKILNDAIGAGYTMFDSGRLYGHSEKYIGEVISAYNRDNLYLITKVCEDDLKRYPNTNNVHDTLSLSLKFLKTDYVDAYLLHFPCPNMIEMYKEIEKEYKAGRAKVIGVCNFDVDELKTLMKACEIKPMINQIELNPINTRRDVREFCKENGIIVMAHTPTARSNIKAIGDTNIMKSLTKKYNKSVAQIIYRWHVQNGVIPIVSSVSKEHLYSNLEIFDFCLEDEEMESIEALNQNKTCDRYNNKKSDCADFIYNL